MYRTKPVPAGPARPTTVLDLAAGSSPDLPCRQHDPDLWFSTAPAGLERAKLLCAECPIRRECLAAAVERAEPWGVWGGEIVEHGTVIPRKRPPGRPRKDDPYRVPRVPCRPGSRRLPAGVESDRALLPVRTSEPSCSLDALRTAVRRRNADGRGSEHAPRVGLRAVDVGEAVLGASCAAVTDCWFQRAGPGRRPARRRRGRRKRGDSESAKPSGATGPSRAIRVESVAPRLLGDAERLEHHLRAHPPGRERDRRRRRRGASSWPCENARRFTATLARS